MLRAEPVKVTVLNFVRAETDTTLARYVKQGAFGKIFHIRQPTPIDRQDVIRMNRDTLYSAVIVDLTSPITIFKPESNGRFQSMLIINQDHSMQPVEHGHGSFDITIDAVGTRYAMIVFRTFADANNPADIKAANELQDQIQLVQESTGSFEVPDWDENSLRKTRDLINALAKDAATTFRGFFGDSKKIDPIKHLLGTAFGWGGNPDQAAMYVNNTPAKNDGVTPYILKVRDVPVKGFWSVTVYNAKGFMEKNSLNAYSFNNITAKKQDDGSIIINFGGDKNAPNYLPIMKGWNYTVRLYEPEEKLLSDEWTFPQAEIALK